MPYFNFDLVSGEDFKSQGGMILEDTGIAIDKADNLASELLIRNELGGQLVCSLADQSGAVEAVFFTNVIVAVIRSAGARFRWQ